MHGSLPMLSRPLGETTNTSKRTPSKAQHSPSVIPSIRLVTAIPSATGLSSEANSSFNFNNNTSFEGSSWGSIPSSVLAPKPDSAPKRRLVPKKSKLGLLNVVGNNRDKENGRTSNWGNSSSAGHQDGGNRSFDIYVDSTIDPDIGEFLMVKKKKSRAALDGMHWGPLGEVTNIPTSSGSAVKSENAKEATTTRPLQPPAVLKLKGEEKDKWWSIGRGRKDSKDKSVKEGKENKQHARAKSPEPNVIPIRSKTPEPLKPSGDSRVRFNSLDPGALLISATTVVPSARHASDPEPKLNSSRTEVPAEDFAPPAASTSTHRSQRSIALRAMRSVRSLARIGSWAQLRKDNGSQEDEEGEKEVESKDSSKSETQRKKEKKSKKEKREKKEKKKEEKEAEEKEKTATSTSETGRASPSTMRSTSSGSQTLNRKVSVLGLGLPSSIRLPTLRGGSTASSVISAAQSNFNRLSVESSILERVRSGSVLSNGSSLRPVSTASSNSRVSSNSSSSVRWDEEGLETVKEQRRKERLEKKAKERKEKEEKKSKKRGEKDKAKDKDSASRRALDGKKRLPISEIFPNAGPSESLLSDDTTPRRSSVTQRPLVTVEETGNGGADDDRCFNEDATPTPRIRHRPVSEQLLGKARPVAMYGNDDGVLSALDAATNDLAQLIMTLNLEATPGATPTPLRPSFVDSRVDRDATPKLPKNPLQRTLLRGMSSIASLRPYAQSVRRTGSQLLRGPKIRVHHAANPAAGEVPIGQHIAPWSKLLDGVSSNKKQSTSSLSLRVKQKYSVSPPSTFRRSHRRQTTPAPEPEPAPEFQPLQPAARPKTAPSRVPACDELESSESSIEIGRGGMIMRGAPCSNTFGSRKRGTFNSAEIEKNRVPIPPEARKMLALSGTLGGSDASAIFSVPEMVASDHESDIPEELRHILSSSVDGSVPADDYTLSFRRTVKKGSGPPPSVPLPVLFSSELPSLSTELAMELPSVFGAHIIDDDQDHVADEEEDTIQSFDFTGELKKLKETGGSDRRSFVEQLENAFRTPPQLELEFKFGRGRATVADQLPLSRLPFALVKEEMKDEIPSMNSPGFNGQIETEATTTETEGSDSETRSIFTLRGSKSATLKAKKSTLLPRSDRLSETDDGRPPVPIITISTSSIRPSNGKLNMSFKFGGLPKRSPANAKKRLSLSDIIPPPSVVLSQAESPPMSEEESMDSVLKSIFPNDKTAPSRSRLNSNSSAKRWSRISARSYAGHSRQSSALSFAGFDSFEEVRRGWEFGGPRPVFYPPPPASTGVKADNQRESVLSIPSVSSYGRVINPGIVDPFGFSLPSLQERPVSEDISSAKFSFSVDDTFSFMHRQSRRIRVESDASSFYFRPPLPHMAQDRSNRPESAISVSSPRGSLYNNPNFVFHDLSASGSPAASYPLNNASNGRASWARHRHDLSIDSVINDLSRFKLGRPGLGDKMFETESYQDTQQSYALSSPSDYDQSSQVLPPDLMRNSTCDSIMDVDELRSPGDSIFDKTNQRTSEPTTSVFGDTRGQGFLPPFRPLSVLSTLSVQSPPKEDDTWISMIGGGQIRRNSVASVIQSSPCARVEKRKKKPMDQHEERLSPKKARINEESPVAFVSSAKSDRREQMIKATQEILERRSIEENILVGQGEDSSVSFGAVPVFSRPLPAGRSRSNTCTSSSGADTPSLSSDSSSISGGSQSSIDLVHLNSLLTNQSHSLISNGSAARRTRVRARGQGHRRRYSARVSRHSVYETIEEESNASPATVKSFKSNSKDVPVIVVSSGSVDLTVSDGSLWDSERGIAALDRYYTLRTEAEDAVIESKQIWLDTPFSLYAVQNFRPPHNPEGMKALLQHSVQNFGPLPSELRPRRRSRTHSRPSPYPLARVSRVFHAPESSPVDHSMSDGPSFQPVLQGAHTTLNVPPSPAPSFTYKALSPEKGMLKRPTGRSAARSRVNSAPRRVPSGGAKRNAKSSNGDLKENKENKENVSTGSAKSLGDCLRLNRPRPRGRPANPNLPRPIRV